MVRPRGVYPLLGPGPRKATVAGALIGLAHIELRDAQDLVRRRAALQDLLLAVEAQRDQPALDGGLLHLGGRGALHDLRAQGLLDRQELVDRRASGVA